MDDRTNNCSEAFFQWQEQTCNNVAQGMYRIVTVMQEEEQEAMRHVRRTAKGKATRAHKSVWTRLQKNFLGHRASYLAGDVTLMDYWRRISTIFHLKTKSHHSQSSVILMHLIGL